MTIKITRRGALKPPQNLPCRIKSGAKKTLASFFSAPLFRSALFSRTGQSQNAAPRPPPPFASLRKQHPTRVARPLPNTPTSSHALCLCAASYKKAAPNYRVLHAVFSHPKKQIGCCLKLEKYPNAKDEKNVMK